MAKISIIKSKLASLRDYLLNGGSTELSEITEFLRIEDDNGVSANAYLQRLREKYPEDFEDEDEDEEEQEEEEAPVEAAPANGKTAPEPEAPQPVVQTFALLDEDNVLHDLEVVKTTSKRVVLRRVVPRELVTVLVRREPVEVDLIYLNKLKENNPSAKHLGVDVSLLIALAEIAKG